VQKSVEIARPYYRTRLHVGPGTSDVPYSAVRDEIPARHDDNVYAEIGASALGES
jgi:hypothetical protein